MEKWEGDKRRAGEKVTVSVRKDQEREGRAMAEKQCDYIDKSLGESGIETEREGKTHYKWMS